MKKQKCKARSLTRLDSTQIPVQRMCNVILMVVCSSSFATVWVISFCMKPLSPLNSMNPLHACMHVCVLLFESMHDCFQDAGGLNMPGIARKLGTLHSANASRDWWRILSGGPEPWLSLIRGNNHVIFKMNQPNVMMFDLCYRVRSCFCNRL